MHKNVGVILLAGGRGLRMKSALPKQFLLLKDKPIACYSFDLLANLPGVKEIVVVAAEEFRLYFQLPKTSSCVLTFASPGKRRQDSVYNGLKAIQTTSSLLCIHDAARPLVTKDIVLRTLDAAERYDAAACGMAVKFTLRETDSLGVVVNTPERSRFWEIQTPQAVKRPLLEKGFEMALQRDVTVTDDVALVELLGLPVKLVAGCYSNLKVTTPEDLAIASALLAKGEM